MRRGVGVDVVVAAGVAAGCERGWMVTDWSVSGLYTHWAGG